MFQVLFFALLVRPFVRLIVGLNGYGMDRLPRSGPAVVIANHNSHLDTLVLMSLFPLKLLKKVRPVAAADYFLSNGVLAFLTRTFIGIIPIYRKREGNEADPLEGVYQAIREDCIVIFFPEGTRGEPEAMAPFKLGVAKVSEKFPEVPVVPVYLHGLGKSLPKGEALLVPFFCDVAVGESVTWKNANAQSRQELVEIVQAKVLELKKVMPHQAWE